MLYVYKSICFLKIQTINKLGAYINNKCDNKIIEYSIYKYTVRFVYEINAHKNNSAYLLYWIVNKIYSIKHGPHTYIHTSRYKI